MISAGDWSGGEVVTLGEVMALLLCEGGVPLDAGSRFDLGFAGAEATVAVGLARLGHRTTYVGRVGDDPLGSQVLRAVRGHGVGTDWLRQVPDAPTGLLLRDAPVGRPVSVQYFRSASAGSTVAPEDVPEDHIRAAELLHVTGITAVLSDSARAAVEHAVSIANDAGTTVCLDPNVRHKLASPETWCDVIGWLADRADIVLTGADDARVVTDGDPAAWFLERGASTVVVKDGSRGAWETDGHTTTHQGVVATSLVDAVGAGDAFAAGWIDGWLRGRPAPDRMRAAATVAALCVSARGDVPGLPDARTLQRLLDADSDHSNNDVDR